MDHDPLMAVLFGLRNLVFIVMLLEANTLSANELQQPLFSLEFNIYGTGAEIRLNDIPVYYSDSQGQTTLQKAVPESIINGENILTIRSFPLEDDNLKYRDGAYIEAIISVRESDASPSANNPVLQLKLNPASLSDKVLEGTLDRLGEKTNLISHSEKQTIVSRSTQIKSPFPRWAWQDGQNIEDTPENYNSLLEKYKEVWEALNAGNMDKVRKLYEPAAKEYALSYYYEDKQQGHRLMDTGGFIGKEDWILGNIYTLLNKNIKFHLGIYANGRLARILDDDDRESIIMYLNPKSYLTSAQKFGFYKSKNGEWIMIR